MFIKVVGNKAILDKCTKITIYNIIDGEIYLTKQFKIIYSAFWHILSRLRPPNCETVKGYVIPLYPVTVLTGTTDKETGYVNFKSQTPLSSDNSITNEGIGLSPFRSSYGLAVSFVFEYDVFDDKDDVKVDVFVLRSGDDKIRLFVDDDSNLSSYVGKKGTLYQNGIICSFLDTLEVEFLT